MDQIKSILRFLKYFVHAKTIYNVHSPFLFELLSFTFDKGRNYYSFEKIELLRKELLSDQKAFLKTDFGAGSKSNYSNQTSIGKITRTAVSPSNQCAQMFRLVEFLDAKNILEMGTSVGISTMYLAAQPKRHVIAMEGDPVLIQKAQYLANKLNYQNIEFYEGPFNQTLPKVLKIGIKQDVIFMDGHHAEKPTLDYFEKLQPLIQETTVIIVDDIHWSLGMENAWLALKSHPRVTQSIDFFYYGLLFFRPEFLAKEHHVFRT